MKGQGGRSSFRIILSNKCNLPRWHNYARWQAEKVWVAEAGYFSETMYEDKLKERELQHKHLQDAWSAYGSKVIAVPIVRTTNIDQQSRQRVWQAVTGFGRG